LVQQISTMEMEDFVSFSQRPEWKDITPIKQEDGPNPICAIAYAPQFSETMDYFRAILQKDERSQRALELTEEVIRLSPGNYTAWYFRRLVLEKLHVDPNKELDFVEEMAADNPKNYQIWYHRKAMVVKFNDFSKELKFTAKLLLEENKNYHAWAHRQWVVSSTSDWENELKFVEELLQEDFLNNSAWNERYFVVTRGKTVKLAEETLKQEFGFTMTYIMKAPNNECPWAYLRGLFKDSENDFLSEKLEEFSTKYITCAHVVSYLADIFENRNSKQSLEKAKGLIVTLETRLDTIHAKYWVFRNHQIENKLKKM